MVLTGTALLFRERADVRYDLRYTGGYRTLNGGHSWTQEWRRRSSVRRNCQKETRGMGQGVYEEHQRRQPRLVALSLRSVLFLRARHRTGGKPEHDAMLRVFKAADALDCVTKTAM